MVQCSISGCKNRSERQEEFTFHKFPLMSDIVDQWIAATGRENWLPSQYSRVCSAHFEKRYIVKKATRTHIFRDAVPTININSRTSDTTTISNYSSLNISTPSTSKPLVGRKLLPNDMENYMQYHLMGAVSQVRMKPGCIPKKFACQLDRKTQASDTIERLYMHRNQKVTLEACKKLSEESMVTGHLDGEEITSRTSVKDNLEETQPIKIHMTKTFGSKANQTKGRLVNQMTPLKSSKTLLRRIVGKGEQLDTDTYTPYRTRAESSPSTKPVQVADEMENYIEPRKMYETKPTSDLKLVHEITALLLSGQNPEAFETKRLIQLISEIESNILNNIRFVLRKQSNGARPLHSVHSDLNSPATNKVCRTCLAMDVKLYRISEPDLSLMYERVTGCTISNDDKLPQMICWECVAKLSSANRFIDKALETQASLVERIDGDRLMTINDVVEARHHLDAYKRMNTNEQQVEVNVKDEWPIKSEEVDLGYEEVTINTENEFSKDIMVKIEEHSDNSTTLTANSDTYADSDASEEDYEENIKKTIISSQKVPIYYENETPPELTESSFKKFKRKRVKTTSKRKVKAKVATKQFKSKVISTHTNSRQLARNESSYSKSSYIYY